MDEYCLRFLNILMAFTYSFPTDRFFFRERISRGRNRHFVCTLKFDTHFRSESTAVDMYLSKVLDFLSDRSPRVKRNESRDMQVHGVSFYDKKKYFFFPSTIIVLYTRLSPQYL